MQLLIKDFLPPVVFRLFSRVYRELRTYLQCKFSSEPERHFVSFSLATVVVLRTSKLKYVGVKRSLLHYEKVQKS